MLRAGRWRAASGIRVVLDGLLHNTRLGMLHPAHVARNARRSSWFSLCPASPEAALRAAGERHFGELPAGRIELETPSYMGFTHGYHHEKDGVGLTPGEDFLLSICFCDHCLPARRGDCRGEARLGGGGCRRARPRAAGITLSHFPAKGIAAFEAIEPLFAFLEWRDGRTGLIGEIRQEAHPDTKVIGSATPPPGMRRSTCPRSRKPATACFSASMASRLPPSPPPLSGCAAPSARKNSSAPACVSFTRSFPAPANWRKPAVPPSPQGLMPSTITITASCPVSA